MPLPKLAPVFGLLLGMALFASTGCTSLVQSDRVQCSTSEDCTKRGGEFVGSICVQQVCQPPGPWSCLGSVVWPTPGNADVTATLHLADIVTGQPVSGVAAQLCHKLDATCASPLATGLSSDAEGRVIVQAPPGFDGYVELTAAEIMRGSYFFYPPLTANRDVPAVPILRVAALTTLAAAVGTQLQPDRGQLMLRSYNCIGQMAEGVRFSSAEADNSTTPFYMIKSIPSIKATETDSSGAGGLLNLRAGAITLTGALSTGETIGTISVFTRAGEVTYTTLVPTPR